ncbi:hypothetical protein LA5095_00929 [Roseibium album]|uniref:Uncharacterized protein n=1 Tax=Roseibium album TaxID=311410 RepID=A0A0M7AIL6_9HYPH|nr:hypothetical protein LA5094_03042 [Roseibium album]CTQ66698.1 hypothetical protein LA5095_00929 [Roseibium album]CTQ74487.1 hypothetical protein LA5096_04067 [Roseibium album]
MRVQTLCFEPSVESLNERIVGVFARRGDLRRNAALASSQIQSA